jgi:hypothetical protein
MGQASSLNKLNTIQIEALLKKECSMCVFCEKGMFTSDEASSKGKVTSFICLLTNSDQQVYDCSEFSIDIRLTVQGDQDG